MTAQPAKQTSKSAGGEQEAAEARKRRFRDALRKLGENKGPKKVRKGEPDNPFTMAQLKAKFPGVCRSFANSYRKGYVIDKAEDAFMIITSSRMGISEQPMLTVNANYFRTHFSRLAALVRLGICFEITEPRDGKKKSAATEKAATLVYLRRHTGYVDPAQEAMQVWHGKVVNACLPKFLDSTAINTVDQKALAALIREVVTTTINCGQGDQGLHADYRDKPVSAKRPRDEVVR